MLFNDDFYVAGSDPGVEGPLWVDDHDGTLFAESEAARAPYLHLFVQIATIQLLAKGLAYFRAG
jgi:hypothetical protein